MVFSFHTFGGGRRFSLVFLDHPSFLCHSILFQGTDFSIFFSKVSSTIHYHSLLPYFEGGGRLGLVYFLAEFFTALIDSLLGALIPYLLKSLLCHPSLFSHSVILRRLSSLILSKYYPSILYREGFAYFLALLFYPPFLSEGLLSL